jgi:hypothetical protein
MFQTISPENLYSKISEFLFLFNHMHEFLHFFFSPGFTITLLQTAKLRSRFWSYACQTAIYLINRMSTAVLHHSFLF